MVFDNLTLPPSMCEVMFGSIQPGPRPILWALPPVPTFWGSLMRTVPPDASDGSSGPSLESHLCLDGNVLS